MQYKFPYTYIAERNRLQQIQSLTKVQVGIIFLIITTYLRGVGFSAESSTPYVCKFLHGAKAAYSITFDDGYREHYSIAAPLLEEYGFHGTFFIIPGEIAEATTNSKKMNWDQLRDLAKRGHEIANHTMQHVRVSEESVTQAQYLVKNKADIDMLTFAAPGNDIGTESLNLVYTHGLIAYRTRCIGYCTSHTELYLNTLINKLIQAEQDTSLLIHAILPGSGYQAFPDISVFENHLKYLRSLKDTIWVDTFVNVAKYKQNRRCSEVVTKNYDDTGFVLSIKYDTSSCFYSDIPLTICVPLPTNKTSISIFTNDGHEVKVDYRDKDAYFDLTMDNTKEYSVKHLH